MRGPARLIVCDREYAAAGQLRVHVAVQLLSIS